MRIIEILTETILLRESMDFLHEPTFLKQVQDIIDDHYGDWSVDYEDLGVLSEAVSKLMKRIQYSAIDGSTILVSRSEIRPKKQFETLNFGSLGIHWTWDAGNDVYNPDNAYDEHGREGIVELVFDAEVALDAIDWPFTIASNLVLPGEQEICIKDGSFVTLETIYTKDGFQHKDVNIKIHVTGSYD